jgi:predicted MFS family arabinose efflux permease
VRERHAILALILAAQTVANVGPLGIPAIAALIRDDLGLTLAQAGSFLSAYYVGPILMSLPAGTMADQWGIARTLVLGQLVIAAGLVAVSAAGSYAVLIVLMMLAGVGYGMLNPTSTKAVMAWFPPSQRATVVGLKQVGLPFGGALGAALLPVLALAAGWRLAVVTSAALIGAGAVASFLIYRDPPGLPPPPSGVRGAVRAVLLTRDLWLVALSTLVFAGMQTVWLAFLVLYLKDVVGLSLLAASRYLALAQVAGMAGRIAFGVLSDRTFGGRRRAPLVLGLAAGAAGAALRVLRGRLERRAAHAHGRARRAALRGHGPRAGARGVVAGRHRRASGVRLVRRVAGWLPRALDRPSRHDVRCHRPAGPGPRGSPAVVAPPCGPGTASRCPPA